MKIPINLIITYKDNKVFIILKNNFKMKIKYQSKIYSKMIKILNKIINYKIKI